MVPTSANVSHYADIVQKKATLRRIITAATEITSIGYEEDEDVEESLDRAERAMFGVSEKYNKNTFVPIRSVLQEAFDRIDELHRNRGKLRGVPTGFRELDSLLAGLQKSDLVILAARPSVGKTSLALDIARQIGINSKLPVGFFSLEMSKDQLVDRMICAQANVDLWKLRTGRLSDRDDDFPRIGNALGELSEAPIFIDDSAGLNVMQLRTKARRLKNEHGLGVIVVDYLQLMEGRGSKNSGQPRTGSFGNFPWSQDDRQGAQYPRAGARSALTRGRDDQARDPIVCRICATRVPSNKMPTWSCSSIASPLTTAIGPRTSHQKNRTSPRSTLPSTATGPREWCDCSSIKACLIFEP